MIFWLCFLAFFFFKQKTAYEMRISDWSSDVCSSDLLLMYPLAGWLGTLSSPAWGAASMAVIVVMAVVAGFLLWPSRDPEVLIHHHDDLPLDHSHLTSGEVASGHVHAHPSVIDDMHPHWPPPK